ncbi:unnamed protein product [Ostreobium quekettii]|uniref:Uncharacterized protein n=1 Tax=Ostreobium quekettii TaxID=121088 RepID=A0A8S1J6V8_9CHLO|nr:unnamed protein product [Ostreobium quekettii]
MQAPAATAHGDALSPSCGHFRVARRSLRLLPSRIKRCAAQGDPATTAEDNGIDAVEEEVVKPVEIDIRGVASQADITQFAKKAAGTFAPRASGAVQNPAYKGSLLYNVFGWQAWASMVVRPDQNLNEIVTTYEKVAMRLSAKWLVHLVSSFVSLDRMPTPFTKLHIFVSTCRRCGA